MQIQFAKYQQKRVGDRRDVSYVRDIAFVRITGDSETFGYAELAPLQSWGHAPLDDILSTGTGDSLFNRVVSLAEADLLAKEESRSLVNGCEALDNHLLVSPENLNASSEISLKKVKLGANLELETKQLVAALSLDKSAMVRLDFNGCFKSADDFLFWWKALPCKEQVEFVEDPVLSALEWERVARMEPGIPLAADQMAGLVAADIVVVKPSWQDPEAILQNYSNAEVAVVVTHVLGSALDQAQSLAEALRIKKLGWSLRACGLLAEDSAFVQKQGKIYSANEINGFGVDLKSMELLWQDL